MKILNLQQFLMLPENILYTKFDNGSFKFSDIAIKDKSLKEDWWFQDLMEIEAYSTGEIYSALSNSVNKGTSFSLDLDYVSRDGLYEEEQLFAVFEKDDVISLIERFKVTLDNYPKL
jgi:hypothetical protein